MAMPEPTPLSAHGHNFKGAVGTQLRGFVKCVPLGDNHWPCCWAARKPRKQDLGSGEREVGPGAESETQGHNVTPLSPESLSILSPWPLVV